MPRRLRMLLATGALLIAQFLPTAAWAYPYTALYVFGDSLSDSGNNAAVFDTLGAQANLPPGTLRTATPLSGPFVPTYPYASDRYSNGPVWAEQFAASLGLSAKASFAGGTNYAFGGATTGPAGSSFPFSLRDQVSTYLGSHGNAASASALYVVEGGGNDARAALQAALAALAQGIDPTALITGYTTNYVANIVAILGQLKGAGAQDILLWNIPDIGKIPAVAALGPGAAAAASNLVLAMNMALELTLAGLPPVLLNGLHQFDAYGAFNDIVANPAAFGLADAATPCGASAACVADPTGYFFWDGIHPTTAGHAVIASLAVAAIPEPASLFLLALGLVALCGSRRQRL